MVAGVPLLIIMPPLVIIAIILAGVAGFALRASSPIAAARCLAVSLGFAIAVAAYLALVLIHR